MMLAYRTWFSPGYPDAVDVELLAQFFLDQLGSLEDSMPHRCFALLISALSS